MKPLIDPTNPRYTLGIPGMDRTHAEFMTLVNRLGEAEGEAFIELYKELLAHTRAHFESENELMKLSGFPPIQIHMGEHERVLAELVAMGDQLTLESVESSKTILADQVPAWFDQHAQTMDSALAAHLKHMNLAQSGDPSS